MKSNILSYSKTPIIIYSVQLLQADNTIKTLSLTKDSIYTVTYILEGTVQTNTGRLKSLYMDGEGAIHLVLDISDVMNYKLHDTCTILDIVPAT